MDENEGCGFFLENVDEEVKETVQEDPSIILPVSSNAKCKFCNGIPLDIEIKKTFGINVCSSCSRTELKYITKTKCTSEYLLTSDELKQFKYLSRPNPHKGTWNDMQLYLEAQIVEYALKKYDSLENIELEKDNRKVKKKQKKLDKMKKRVKELKRKTFIPHQVEKHQHKFVTKNGYSECECGMRIEEEEI